MIEQNPIIGSDTEETLLNIYSVLALVQDFHNSEKVNDSIKDRSGQIGLSLILKCTNQALNYEINRLGQSANNVSQTSIFEA